MLKKLLLYHFLLIGFFVKANTITVCQNCQVKTLKQAVEMAQPNDTILVEKGTYKVHDLTIDKPLVILGKNRPIIDGERKGEILVAKTSDIVIKGFHFKGVGESFTKDYAAIRLVKSNNFIIEDNTFEDIYYGIFLEKSNDGIVKQNQVVGRAKEEYNSGNAIHLWYCNRVTIENNDVSKSRDGIYFEFVSESTIKGNKSYNNLRYGLHFMFSNNNIYYKNEFCANGAGVAVMFSKFIEMKENIFQKNWGKSSYGLLLKEIYDSKIIGNTFHQNTVGINGEGCTRIDYEENTFSENGWGIRIRGACYTNNFFHNNFENNTFDVSYSNKVHDNKFENNYWSDYTGYDLDKNGIGDVPFRPVKLFSYIANKTPESVVLLRSLFIDIINFSEKVAPSFTPENLIDPSPLMRPYPIKK
ncbi:nitrous oxide reductase family maturation protein NosD [Capnocytophaga stomatis]|uniref:Nitrous oxide reductase n=2 Tax=Capnocytophaga TaxID=1016 RepID=A0A250FYI0_9FLAO|nr:MULTISPECIES: nitrous oxide reductase family maturation protein NosD [Capnocytophaga]ATA90123.1 nitrous oxide reductase [Capnocytophaga stomatis]